MKPRIPQSNYNVILNSAIKLAEKVGRDNISFKLLAEDMKISRTVLYTYFINTENLKSEILKHALKTDNIILIIEALIFNHVKQKDISVAAKEKISEFFK